MTVIDLEFGAGFKGAMAVSDIAASLVSLDELLRDLASIAASGAEYRSVEVASIEMRSPLTVKLSVSAVPAQSLRAFQQICRSIILSRPVDLEQIITLLEQPHVTDTETQRLNAHIAALRNAVVPLTRVEIKEPSPSRSPGTPWQ